MQSKLRLLSTLFAVSLVVLSTVGFVLSVPFAYGDTTATPALVQSVHNSTAGNATFASAVTSGNTVIVGVTAWQTTLPANDITDSKGNTYVRIAETVNATTGDHAALFYAKNVIGGATFKVTAAAGDTIAIHEYSGLSTSSPLDTTASATGLSNAPASANVTTANANELYFGLAWSGGNNDTWIAGSGYTIRQTEINNNNNERIATEDKVLAAAGTSNASFTTGKSNDWIAIVATFKPAVTGTGTTTPPPAPKPTITSFTALPSSITSGASSTLSWVITNASTTSIDNGVGTVTGTSKVVSPTATTTYTITATNPQGSVTATVTVNVAIPVVVTPPPPAKPTITSFSASPTSITTGQSSTLSWATTGATLVTIDQGVGTVTGTSKSVSPTATTTYTLSAGNSAGTTTATVSVNVAPVVVTPPPLVKPTITSFTATPASITAGQSSTLSWATTGATLITIDNGVGTVTGTSKSVSPTATTTYTLSAGNTAGTTTTSVVVNVAPVVVTPPPANNLIPNGNLEAGSTNNPTGWSNDYWGSLTAKFTYPVTGNGGGKAAQLQITSFSSGAANWIFDHVTDSTHSQYQFTEDYMATVPTELDIEYLMSDGTYDYEWLQTVQASATWKSLSAQVTPPAGAVSFTVLHILAAKGTLTIDNASLTALNDPFAAGMVSFIFDDGLLSQYQNAVPILKTAGFNAGFYIITTEPTSGDSGYMSWAQIKDLNTRGYEVGGHTRTHPYLTTLTPSQLTGEVSGSFSDLVAQGITPKTFVYPFGDTSPTVEAAVKTAGYQAARGSYFGLNGTATDRYDLYDIRVDSTSNLATLEADVNQAKADKRWLVLELHDVLSSGGDEYSITPAFLQSLVTYIKNSGIQVATMQQGMTQLSN